MRIEVKNRFSVCQIRDMANEQSVAIISITNPNREHPDIPVWPGLRGVLRLKFDDVNDEQGREFNLVPMTDEDADRVAEFVNRHVDVDLLVVNCDAGVCRSAGMAGAIMKHFTGGDSDIFDNPMFIPNMWVNKKTREALIRYCESAK